MPGSLLWRSDGLKIKYNRNAYTSKNGLYIEMESWISTDGQEVSVHSIAQWQIMSHHWTHLGNSAGNNMYKFPDVYIHNKTSMSKTTFVNYYSVYVSCCNLVISSVAFQVIILHILFMFNFQWYIQIIEPSFWLGGHWLSDNHSQQMNISQYHQNHKGWWMFLSKGFALGQAYVMANKV